MKNYYVVYACKDGHGNLVNLPFKKVTKKNFNAFRLLVKKLITQQHPSIEHDEIIIINWIKL